jgi:hypothetical protein
MAIEYTPFHDKPSFIDAVSSLFEIEAPAADRIDAVQRITDEYFVIMGETPDPIQLSRLGTYILRDTPDEKAQREKNVLSRRQLDYRKSKEIYFDHAQGTLCLEHKLYGHRASIPVSEREAG